MNAAQQPPKSRKYLIYFIHDLHGYIEGVPARSDPMVVRDREGAVKPITLAGGIKGIVEYLRYVMKTHIAQEKADDAFICLGGDMVSEYRSRMLARENVSKVWKYVLDELVPHAWVLGNHELDPEYEGSLLPMILHAPATCCTENVIWSSRPPRGKIPADVHCSHRDKKVPLWAHCVMPGDTVKSSVPVVFTGLTEAKAGWDKAGYRRNTWDDCQFYEEDIKHGPGWQKFWQQLLVERRYPLLCELIAKYLGAPVSMATIGKMTKAATTRLQSQVLVALNKIVGIRRFYWDNQADLAPITKLKRFPVEAIRLTELPGEEATEAEDQFLNRSLIRFAFKPELACKGRCIFRVLNPADVVRILKGPSLKKGCPRTTDSFVHVHIAHFSDMRPPQFGGRDGPWLNGKPGGGLPTVILKAHDHWCSPEGNGTIPRTAPKETAPTQIPAFEAGRNGAAIGRLTLTIAGDTIDYDWRVLFPLTARAFTREELRRMGVNQSGSVKTYPLVAHGLRFGRISGSMVNSDELYRAVTLLLRSLDYWGKGYGATTPLAIASPGLVITDAYIDNARNQGKIDLFDIGHVFNHRELAYGIRVDRAEDLVAGIVKGFNCPQIDVSILPPMCQGQADRERSKLRDVKGLFYCDPELLAPDAVVSRVICLRHKGVEYLAVAPGIPPNRDIVAQDVHVYRLVQSQDLEYPEFCRSNDAPELMDLGRLIAETGPIHSETDGFLARRFAWQSKLDSAGRQRLMQVVADYVRHCSSTTSRALWQ